MDPKQIFLVSGQVEETKVGGRKGVRARVEQRVVVAATNADVYGRLSAVDPGFRPLGMASLMEYEDAAARIRAVVEGQSEEWPLVKAT